MLFIALAIIVHIRNMPDQKIPVLSAFHEAPCCENPLIPIYQGIQYDSAPLSALQTESVIMFFKRECPKPTQSGGSLGLSFIPLKVVKTSN